MAMTFGSPGGYLSSGNNFSQLLASQPNYNNGTTYGGLASALNQGLMGLMMRDQRNEDLAGQQAMLQAMQAMQGTPASTIEFNQPTRPDGTGDPIQLVQAQAPNRNLAMQLLASNPKTAPLAFQMAAQDEQRAADQQKMQQQFENAKALKAINPPPADVQSYKFALENGFKGSFTQFLQSKSAASAGQPSAPIQNFTKRQSLVAQFGEDSPEVRTFDNYVRALPFLNAGPEFVQPGISGSNTTPQVVPKGLNPGEQPSVKGDQARETAKGKIEGENTANAPEAAGRAAAITAPLDRLYETVDEILKSPGLEARTGLSSYVPSAIQGDDARNMQAKMETLKSQIAQNVLQMYRSMSQTGGAVGQVSDAEQRLFQNNLAALDQAQTMPEFMNQLQKIQQFVQDSKGRISQAYQAQYGNAQQPQQGGASGEWTDMGGGVRIRRKP